MRLAPPTAHAVPTVRVYAASAAGRVLLHPVNRRGPGADGVDVPDDAFTTRRIADGDWTATEPVPAKPAKAESAKSKSAKA